MIKTKIRSALVYFISAIILAAPHLAYAQAALTYQHPSQASPVPLTGPVTSLTAPINTDPTHIGNAISGAVPAGVNTTAINNPATSTISPAMQSTLYTQTQTEISALNLQLTTLTGTTSSPAIAAQIAAVQQSIANCNTRSSILNPSTNPPVTVMVNGVATQQTTITGNELNVYHCP